VKDLLAFLSVILLGTFLFLFCFIWVWNETAFPAQAGKIEQLRHDLTLVSGQSSEDAVGQATEWNQTIISNQTYNKMWVISWMIPDGWDNIKIIEIGDN